ncbi:zinc finger CCHC domain-containing protein 8 [Denticeps clupeoides]|nr:zinc finger CCHC domain-containing protein 8 [Denticeps clupeoides]
MADVDFGDCELFDQLDEDGPVAVHAGFACSDASAEVAREPRAEPDAAVERLSAENEELRRKLGVLTRPRGLTLENSRTDGPLLHLLYGNNDVSKACRQEIEDSIFNIVSKYQRQNDKEGGTCYLPPQASSFAMEINQEDKATKKTGESFSVVGSVLYFNIFCLDKLGQPLLNDTPQLTDGWEVPKYSQVFSSIIAKEGQEVQIKEKRPRPCCFNCDSLDHQLKDCPEPKNMARINERRKEFSQAGPPSGQRYHFEEVEERFAKYKPGILSEELMGAMDVAPNTLPPFIYRMRELGYPPGWLKEAEEENSGLTLYDGKALSEGDSIEDGNGHYPKMTYDLSKLIDFPGFNATPPQHVKDNFHTYGSIPMQYQQMKHNFAAYLSSKYPSPGSKRHHEAESTPRHAKKSRCTTPRSSDMEVDSEIDSPRRPWNSESFHFQPPLPPGSPGSFSSPPPLPPGTPPVTPTPPPLPKGTPPVAGSPAQTEEESEDGLTLEELEEQQRLIWAALETADTATTSDSEAGATATPVLSSPGASTPARLDAEVEIEPEVVCNQIGKTPSAGYTHSDVSETQDVRSSPESPDAAPVPSVEETVSDESKATSEHSHTMVVEPHNPENRSDEPDVPKITAVPHRSKFAAGIIPFEDTPEFTEVAEATGTYLKIRDLLKGSPRNQAKQSQEK